MQTDLVEVFSYVFDFIIFILPLALPVALIWIGVEMWIEYKRKQFRNSLKWVLLEIIPPADVAKSPAGMELFFLSLHQTGGESDWWEKYVRGKFRSIFSLELISTAGKIRYFIRTETKNRSGVEAGLYAQFPGIEVHVSEDDYTDQFYWDKEKFDLFAIELGLTKADAYPIKTYIDYSLEKDPDTEFRIDPLAQSLEFLSATKPQNNMWFQIIVRAHKKEDPDTAKLFASLRKKKDNWEEGGKKEIEKIRADSFFEINDGVATKRLSTQQTPGQKDIITAIERSLSKFSFDVGIRSLAIAPKEDLDPGCKAMKGIWKQFGSNNLNGFKPEYSTETDWWFQDPFDVRLDRMKEEVLNAYKQREYFWKDRLHFSWLVLFGGQERKKMVLNGEELATIYHFLGKTSEVPSVSKVEARKAAPPSNLPI